MADKQELGPSIEQQLRWNLADARQRYEQAKKKFDNALEVAHDVGKNMDGLHAVLSATKEYNRFLADYNEALHRFWKFVLQRGKAANYAAKRVRSE